MAALPEGSDWHQGDEDDLSLIESCYCPNCRGGNATTTMLPTKVPFFREIIIMSLSCNDCHFRNSEISFGGAIQERGEKICLQVTSPDDLNRQIIKSDSASLSVPSLQFEIPPGTQRGSLSTLEGMLKRAADNLEELQPERLRLGDVDNFHRCRNAIQRLRRMAGGEGADQEEEEEEEQPIFPFDIVLDDTAGNSYIENPLAPNPDPHLTFQKYNRTPHQDMALGLQPSQQAVEAGMIDDSNPQHKNPVNAAHPEGSHPIAKDKELPLHSLLHETSVGRQEVLKFSTSCPHCHIPTETDMCVTDIPHFKEVIIMSMLCERCGFKSNEIKGGGAIPKYATVITLTVRTSEDLAREVLKSDTAGIAIPELDLELDEGGLDGLYTTIEGLLVKMRERLEHANPFGSGDAARMQHTTNDGGDFSEPSPYHARYMAFLAKLKDMAEGNLFPFTLILSDPLSNSFVGPVPADAIALSLQAEKEGSHQCYHNYVDLGMKIEEHERTHDQNEILGLNDMKTENYQQHQTANTTTDTTTTASDRDDQPMYYGTDTATELPDRLQRLDVRGPDHPHEVGKAPVEGDVTVMGSKSNNFAVPGMGQRGTMVTTPKTTTSVPVLKEDENGTITSDNTSSNGIAMDTATTINAQEITLQKLLHNFEYKDAAFIMNDEREDPREGLVFKDGAQGLGYYTNVPLLELWNKWHDEAGKK